MVPNCAKHHIYLDGKVLVEKYHVLTTWSQDVNWTYKRHSEDVQYTLLTHFSPMSHFYTPWKRQKTIGFLTFSGIEMWHWTKMGWCLMYVQFMSRFPGVLVATLHENIYHKCLFHWKKNWEILKGNSQKVYLQKPLMKLRFRGCLHEISCRAKWHVFQFGVWSIF